MAEKTEGKKKKLTGKEIREALRIYRFILPYKWHFIIGMICLVVSTVFTQTVSLVDLIKGSKNKLPPNCLNVDKDNKCI